MSGGFEFDGGDEISPLKEEEIIAATRIAISEGISSIVLSGVFSPVNPSHELRAAEIVKREIEVSGKGSYTPFMLLGVTNSILLFSFLL